MSVMTFGPSNRQNRPRRKGSDMSFSSLLLGAVAAVVCASATAQEAPTPPDRAYVSTKPPEARRAYFGELHLHTVMSFDA